MSQETRAGRAPHSQCCAPLARTLHVTCRGLLRLRGAQRPYVQLDNASRCILLSLHCVLSLLPRVSDGHPQASARGGLSVERPLHSCMPCSFRCSLYLSLFRLRLPEYTVLLFFCARRLVWCADVSLFSLRCSPSRESLLMLPFAYSLGLPLLAGGIPPTWSLVSGTTPDLSTNEAAGTLYLGTRLTDAPVQSAARVVPPPLVDALRLDRRTSVTRAAYFRHLW